MQQLTGQQLLVRNTGRPYRILRADSGWGKTQVMAYEALWYARFANKRILVITTDTVNFNLALSQFAIQEHDTSEIQVSTSYIESDWFMCIVDQAETFDEDALKLIIKQCAEAKILWISTQPLSKEHWLSDVIVKKRRDSRTRNVDWWIKDGENCDNYTKNQTESTADEGLIFQTS